MVEIYLKLCTIQGNTLININKSIPADYDAGIASMLLIKLLSNQRLL